MIYKNGKPVKIIDIESKKLQSYSSSFSLKSPKGKNFSWYIIKAYGSKRPEKKEFLDIISYCELCEKEIHTEYREITQLAITNPFYFYGTEFREPEPVTPRLELSLQTNNSLPIQNVKVRITDLNSEKTYLTDKNGKLNLKQISPLAELSIEKEGFQTKQLAIYLEYPPLKNYFENIYSGKWSFRNKNLRPGQVPFRIFNFDGLKNILKVIKWTVTINRSKDI